MTKNMHLFASLIALVAAAIGYSTSATAQMSACPGAYAAASCYIGSTAVCQTYSSPDAHRCNLSANADTFNAVWDATNGAFIWGDYGATAFCCTSADLGSTQYKLVVFAYGGDDTINLTFNANDKWFGDSDIYGGTGSDDIYTSNSTEVDYVEGGAGDDEIETYGGADEIWGGAGGDTIRGGDGNDEIYGEGGINYLYGEGDDDDIYGGPDPDYIWGGDGDDDIWGGEDRDTILCGDGDDDVNAGPGEDVVHGEADDDCICGGMDTDADNLYGDGGPDTVYYKFGDDTISSFGAVGSANHPPDLCGCL